MDKADRKFGDTEGSDADEMPLEKLIEVYLLNNFSDKLGHCS